MSSKHGEALRAVIGQARIPSPNAASRLAERCQPAPPRVALIGCRGDRKAGGREWAGPRASLPLSPALRRRGVLESVSLKERVAERRGGRGRAGGRGGNPVPASERASDSGLPGRSASSGSAGVGETEGSPPPSRDQGAESRSGEPARARAGPAALWARAGVGRCLRGGIVCRPVAAGPGAPAPAWARASPGSRRRAARRGRGRLPSRAGSRRRRLRLARTAASLPRRGSSSLARPPARPLALPPSPSLPGTRDPTPGRSLGPGEGGPRGGRGQALPRRPGPNCTAAAARGLPLWRRASDGGVAAGPAGSARVAGRPSLREEASGGRLGPGPRASYDPWRRQTTPTSGCIASRRRCVCAGRRSQTRLFPSGMKAALSGKRRPRRP